MFGLWIVGRAAFVWSGTEPAQLEIARAPGPAGVPTSRAEPPPRTRLLGGIAPTAKASPGSGFPATSADVSPERIIATASGTNQAASDQSGLTSGPGERAETSAFARIDTSPPAPLAAPATIHTLMQPPSLQLPPRPALPNWTSALWMAIRQGSGAGLAAGNGQLGGSQAGMRVYRRLTPALALTGRVSAALASQQTEASAGIALRHGSFAVLAERRFALDRGGRNDWSLTAVAGISDVSLPLKFRLDGYAQAGVVGRDGFADGAVRVERPVAANGKSRLSVGAGAWGSIQPGAARFDVGPQIVGRTVVGGYPMRVSAEWRQRVAGNAAPGSGPVVTFGADF